MLNITIGVGLLLVAYGFYSYGIAEHKSLTALIPAYIGAGFLVLGLVALNEKLRKHAMHLAAMLGLVGFIGGAYMGIRKLPLLIGGDIADAAELNKVRSQNILALVCLIFLILCVKSFIDARRLRKQQGPNSMPPAT